MASTSPVMKGPVAPHFPFQLPPTAIASITHRISGVALFVLLGPALWLVALALGSQEGFEQSVGVLTSWWGKFVVFGFLACLGYHGLAALRHTIQDFGYAETLISGSRSAIILFAVTAVFKLVLIWKIWF